MAGCGTGTEFEALLPAPRCSQARTVELAPTGHEHRGKLPMRLQGVLVDEERAPEGAEPIQRVLLSTLAVDTPEACRKVVEYYARRWRIEDWHRILKSGCKVEELANRSAERIARAPPSTSSSPGAFC